MSNSGSSNRSSGSPNPPIKGKVDARYKMIADLICQGDSIKDASEKMKMSKDRIYHLLADKNSPVNVEIIRILTERREANDRRIMDLYTKALQKLDEMLSSSDEEKQLRAIDRIIKIYSPRVDKNAPVIQQNFGLSEEEKKKIFLQYADEMIIEKRRERGLEPPLQESETPEPPDDETETTEPPDEGPEMPTPSL
jgi:hypothetical protein